MPNAAYGLGIEFATVDYPQEHLELAEFGFLAIALWHSELGGKVRTSGSQIPARSAQKAHLAGGSPPKNKPLLPGYTVIP